MIKSNTPDPKDNNNDEDAKVIGKLLEQCIHDLGNAATLLQSQQRLTLAKLIFEAVGKLDLALDVFRGEES